jgi:hypothetical protein
MPCGGARDEPGGDEASGLVHRVKFILDAMPEASMQAKSAPQSARILILLQIEGESI